jgi:hypothetical protein
VPAGASAAARRGALAVPCADAVTAVIDVVQGRAERLLAIL